MAVKRQGSTPVNSRYPQTLPSGTVFRYVIPTLALVCGQEGAHGRSQRLVVACCGLVQSAAADVG